MRVLGRVVDSTGRPLRDAAVSVVDDTAVSPARSDSSGQFGLSAPRRSLVVAIRAVGYAPRTVRVDPFGEQVQLGDVSLGPVRTELARVDVRADFRVRALADFERRRGGAIGFFVTDSMLVRIPVVTPTAVASMWPRARIERLGGRSERLQLRRGQGFCHPRFFIDGADMGRLDSEEQRAWLGGAKRIEMYTAQNTHPEFNDFDGCGAIVVWTR